MTDYLYVAIVAIGTLAMRISLVAVLANVAIPTRMEQALSLVAPAVLAGLVAQTLFLEGTEVRPFGTWYVAAALAALVAWRTRSFGWTLVVGMSCVWILAALTSR
jgi:branched-subunit amino acid transport protein